MFDIFYVSQLDKNKNQSWQEFKLFHPSAKYATDFRYAQKKCLTRFFWVVWDDLIVNRNFEFNYNPDQWSEEYVHVFKNGRHFDGICLVPKKAVIFQKEIDHRFFVNKKEIDIVASKPKPYDVFEIDSYDEYLSSLKKSSTELFWMSSRNIIADIPDLYFDHSNTYDRKQNHAFIHRTNDQDLYNGLFLCSKHKPLSQKEIEHRHLVDRKEWDIVASKPKPYDVFEIDSYDEYLSSLKKSSTELFWMSSRNIIADIPDLYFDHSNTYDRKQNHAFIHRTNDQDLYNGLFLCSKHKPLSQKEIEHRHLVDRKEWDIVASKPKPYDVFEIDSYDEYLSSLKKSSTELFWMSSRNIIADIPDLYFDHSNTYDRKQNHAFIHRTNDQDLYNGLFLCSKHKPLSQKEIEHRHLVDRKEWDIVASKPKPYDVFEIDSYDEYLSSLKKSSTELFWMSSRNIIADIPDLYFDHSNTYDRKQNHAFIHRTNDQDLYNGLFLCSKHKPLSQKEIEHRHLVDRKEWDIVASKPKPYDCSKQAKAI
jgi:uncharacterized membrane protein